MTGKYIIFERDGLKFPVLFPDHFVKHDSIHSAEQFDTIIEFEYANKKVSAGFFSIFLDAEFNQHFATWGESISLKIKSCPEDSDLIKKQFTKE